MKQQLDELAALGSDYVGRRLYLLYNPSTGRTNGTTPSFFATITMRPPGIVDRPHRHVSAAINYYFRGRGWSVVERQRYEWKAGDLMLSAPGWAVHNHASYDDDVVYELTVQDQPLPHRDGVAALAGGPAASAAPPRRGRGLRDDATAGCGGERDRAATSREESDVIALPATSSAARTRRW